MKVLYYDNTNVRPYVANRDSFHLFVFWQIDGLDILLLGPNTITSHGTLVRAASACSNDIPSIDPLAAGHFDLSTMDGLSWGSQDFSMDQYTIPAEDRGAVVNALRR